MTSRVLTQGNELLTWEIVVPTLNRRSCPKIRHFGIEMEGFSVKFHRETLRLIVLWGPEDQDTSLDGGIPGGSKYLNLFKLCNYNHLRRLPPLAGSVLSKSRA